MAASPHAPAFPARGLNVFGNQKSPEFVEERRLQLETYLRRLTGMPSVLACPDFLAFFGFDVRTGRPRDSRGSRGSR